MPFPDEWIELLACPKCRGELERQVEPEGFGCAACGLFYPVEEGVPNFLIDEAVPWIGPGEKRSSGR